MLLLKDTALLAENQVVCSQTFSYLSAPPDPTQWTHPHCCNRTQATASPPTLHTTPVVPTGLPILTSHLTAVPQFLPLEGTPC